MAKKGTKKVKTEAEKKEAFRAAAEKKVNTSLKAIAALARLSNPAKYAYTAHQIDQIKEAFKDTLDAAFSALDGKKIPEGGFKLS